MERDTSNEEVVVRRDLDDRDITSKRDKAKWVLDTTGMAKSGFAPRKHTLAEWVVDLCDEVERLRAALDTIGHPNHAVRATGRDAEEMAAFARQAREPEVTDGVD